MTVISPLESGIWEPQGQARGQIAGSQGGGGTKHRRKRGGGKARACKRNGGDAKGKSTGETLRVRCKKHTKRKIRVPRGEKG